MVDLTDGGFLGKQLTLPAAQLGDVPDEDQRAGPLAPHDERDGAELHDRAVAVDLRLLGRTAPGDEYQRLVNRLARSPELRGGGSEFGTDQVRGQRKPAIRRLRVPARGGYASAALQP